MQLFWIDLFDRSTSTIRSIYFIDQFLKLNWQNITDASEYFHLPHA